MNREFKPSAITLFSWGLNPNSRASFLGPVLAPGGRGLRGETFRFLPCLLTRVIEFSNTFTKEEIIEEKGSKEQVLYMGEAPTPLFF